MARKKAMTRAEMISTLKSRGQKGALSKMTKPQLKALLDKTAPPGAHSHEDKPKSEIALEPDEQGGGHYFRKNGETVSDGAHEHKNDPWPVSEAKKSKKTPAKKASRKKLDPIEDPDADITVALVNKRLNADRHPATGRKISGTKAERLRWLLRGREFGTRPITEEDVEQRLDNIDKEYNSIKEWRKYKDLEGEIDESNTVEGKRARKKPDRLGDRGPDAFAAERQDEQDGDGMSYHAFMRKHLKQYGGNMSKAAAAYREMKGGHYARADGSVRAKDKGKYGHTHKPGTNAAVNFEDAQQDEPERAPSPPSRRITRNVSPRTRRRLERGQRGNGKEQDGGNWWTSFKDDAKDVGDSVVAGAKATWAEGKHLYNENETFIKKHKWAADLEHGVEGVAAVGLAATGVGALAEGAAAGVAGIEGLTEGLTLTADAAADAGGEIQMDAFTGSLEDGEGTLTSAAGDDAGAAGDDAGAAGDDAPASKVDRFKANVTKVRNFAGTAVVGDELGNEVSDVDAGYNEPESGPAPAPAPPDPDPGEVKRQFDLMRQQQQQQEQMHANANAFAANTAALRHSDYLNPF